MPIPPTTNGPRQNKGPTGKDMRRKLPYIYLAECIGTALLVAVGLSVVIFDKGDGCPILALGPDRAARRPLTALCLGYAARRLSQKCPRKVRQHPTMPIVSF